MEGSMKRFGLIAAMAGLLSCAAPCVRAQDPGPMAAPPKFDVKRIPAPPHPGPPPIPESEIIRKCAVNEDVMKKQYDGYSFARTIRIEELTDPGGKFVMSGVVYTKPDGERTLRVEKQAESNLKQPHFTPEDGGIRGQRPLV